MSMSADDTGCLICGSPIEYTSSGFVRRCAMCGREELSHAVCANGHYVCNSCHSSAVGSFLRFFSSTTEKDPVKLFYKATELPSVHIHGPEHHTLVPCALVAAYSNCCGLPDSGELLSEVMLRSKKVPGGTCGYWGVCGASAGAGIFASVVLDSSPMNSEVWHLPQILAAKCLMRNAEIGGPRCCKRTGRIAIEEAAEFCREHLGVNMPLSKEKCAYYAKNRECIGKKCPYFPYEQ